MLNPTILVNGDETCTVDVDGADVRVRYSYPGRELEGLGDVVHTGVDHAAALTHSETQLLPEVRGDGFREVTDDPLTAASLTAVFASCYRPDIAVNGDVFYGTPAHRTFVGIVGEGVDGARGRTAEDLRLVTAAELPPFALHGPLAQAGDLLRVATALVALALAAAVTKAQDHG